MKQNNKPEEQPSNIAINSVSLDILKNICVNA
jgi:hypothetical protein